MGEVLLSSDITSQLMSQSGLVGGMAGLLKESSSGRVRVPFRLGGNYSSPKVALDFSVRDQMKDNMKDKFNSAIQDLMKRK